MFSFETASGPVRLFTPYKRRKRNQTDNDGETGGPKRKRNTNNNNNNILINNTEQPQHQHQQHQHQHQHTTTVVDDNNMFLTEDNITSKDEPWPTLNDSLDTSTELVDQTQIGNPYDRETFVVNINDPGPIALLDNSQTMKTLENVYCTMVKATNDFKRILTDLKNTYDRKIEILQKERDAAVTAMRVQVHTDIDDPNISGSLHGNELISAKKVSWKGYSLSFIKQFFKRLLFIFSSALIVIVKHWLNVHYAERLPIVLNFVNEKIGMPIKLNVQEIQLQLQPNKLCSLWMSSPK